MNLWAKLYRPSSSDFSIAFLQREPVVAAFQRAEAAFARWLSGLNRAKSDAGSTGALQRNVIVLSPFSPNEPDVYEHFHAAHSTWPS